jgi:hypothetical protein
MAKKMNPYDKQHNANLTRYQKLIEAIYNSAATEAARIAASTQGIDTDIPFRFDDYPLTRKRVEKLMESLKANLQATIINGINAEWTLSNNKNNELANILFGDNVGKLTPAQYRRYYSTNDNARQAFLARKVNGLSLSSRVWQYTDQFKEEIELGLDVGLRNGLSADEMSRDLRSYLRHPDKLFRRVRDERGQLHLSKAAAAFHPGRGVYRSSYMNARRLAATETNIAYRTSDHARWQQMDFVVGIEIVLSNNHTVRLQPGETTDDKTQLRKDGTPKANAVRPLVDICDTLAGRYPKDFKFTGWHPHCRCHAVSILKTQNEIAEDTRKIMNGEAPDTPSVNEVRDVPPAFRDWVQNNAARIVKSNSLPYFMKDNPTFVSKAFGESQKHTRIASVMGQSGVFDYAERMKNDYPKIAALWDELDDGKIRSDIERAMLLNQLKQECANATYSQLEKWGVTNANFTMTRLLRDSPINDAIVYTDNRGRQIAIKSQLRDMIILKDKFGKEFGYPVGIQQEQIGVTAVDASDIIQSFPPYLRKGIQRISFMAEENPVDPYWRVKYKNPKHISAATDGGKTHFWLKVSKSDFKGYMAHEAAHILDGAKNKITSTAEWQQAVEADIKFWTSNGGKLDWAYVSKYAMTNHSEDFAESMREYITNHKWFKKSYPNRAAYIRKMAQRLSKKL